MIRLSNGVISKEAYYVHANIIYLIDEAVNMDQNFMSYPVVKCREILMQMAKQELAEMAPSGRVRNGSGYADKRTKQRQWRPVRRQYSSFLTS